MDIPLSFLLLASAITFLGAFVQTSIGFGLAIVSAPLLFLISPAYVPGPVILATMANCAFNLWYFRAHLNVRDLMPAMVARIPGSFGGAMLLWLLSVEMLAVFIAVVIALGALANYLRLSIPFNRFSLAIAGFCSGLMGTATAIGGPPMAILLQGQAANVIRGQLAAFFLFSCVISLSVLLVTGHFGGRELLMGLLLMPGILLGSWMGALVSGRLSEGPMRKATLLLCTVSILVMLSRYLAAPSLLQ